MKASELKQRARDLAVAILKLTDELPKTEPVQAVTTPLIRCGLGVGSAYRQTCRTRNQFDFATRIGMAEDAADECGYWLEILLQTQALSADRLQPILDEITQLRRIFTKSRKAATKRYRSGPANFNYRAGENDIPF